ncbi:hypothetical protein K474DRAFT_248173 [Panus rudis PR-1116 ss-1]|nr:hypothetical protein K474DRAFT_248173 [Panus rudis PR-1116 ss-1]
MKLSVYRRPPPCPELGKLPPATTFPKHLDFKRVVRGTVSQLVTLPSGGGRRLQNVLDPTHPAALLPRRELDRILPKHRHKVMTMRMFPNGLLSKVQGENEWSDPPFHYTEESDNPDHLKVNLSMVSGLKLHRSCRIRDRCAYRIKQGIGLVVTRGAKAEKSKEGEESVVFDASDAGSHWLVRGKRRLLPLLTSGSCMVMNPGWTYAVYPTLETYKMPWPAMISAIRECLINVAKCARRHEAAWNGQQIGDGRLSEEARSEVLAPKTRHKG